LAILLIPFALAALTFPLALFDAFGHHPIGFFVVLIYALGVYFFSFLGCSVIGVVIKSLIKLKQA